MKRISLLSFIAIVLSVAAVHSAFAQCANVSNTITLISRTDNSITIEGSVNIGAACTVTEVGAYWSYSSGIDGSDNRVFNAVSQTNTNYTFQVTIPSLNPGVQVYFRTFARSNSADEISNSDETSFTFSVTPSQLAPADVTVVGVSSSQINITTPGPSSLTNPATGFIVYRNSGSAPTVPALTNGSGFSTTGDYYATITTTTSFPLANNGLSAETHYYYTFVPFRWDGANFETRVYNTTSTVTKSDWTFSNEPDDQPDEALTATATSPINVNLGFAPTNSNGIADDDRYVILRREGSNPDLSTLVDGTAASSTTYFLHQTTTDAVTTYSDGTALPNKTYHYAIIPFGWIDGNNETINYRITNGPDFNVRYATATTPASSVTLTGLTTGGANGLANNFIGSETDQGIIGFSLLSTDGPYTFNGVTFSIDNDPSGRLSNFELIVSTDGTLGNGDDLSLGSQPVTVGSPSTLAWSGLNRSHVRNTTYYFFLKADVDISMTAGSSFTVSFDQASISVTDATVGSTSINRTISADPLTTTIGSLNSSTAPNNIEASPLQGAETGKAIFGFSLQSNLTQTVTEVRLRFDADPSGFLENFAIVSSGDDDFSTANSAIVLDAPPSVSGTGPYFVTFNPAVDFATSGTPLYFFITADVFDNVASGTSVFQPSLTPADITVTMGIAAGTAMGIDYDLMKLSTVIASLNNTGSPNNISASPLVATHTGQAVFGFSLTGNGPQTVSLVRVQFDADPTPFLQNFAIVSSADDDFSTANANVPLDAALTISGTGPYFLDIDPVTNFNVNGVTLNFFLTADVKAGAGDATSAFQPSLLNTQVTVNQGLVEGSATGIDFDVDALLATIGSLNSTGTPNNIAPSPLVAATTGRAIFGFSLTSNGTQTVSEIRVRFDADPTPFLENYSLVSSADNDFSTANSAVPVTPVPAISGTGPYFLTFNPNVDIDITNTTANFFVVADVKGSAAVTPSAFQPSLTTADVDVSGTNETGSASGIDYSIDELRATIASLNTVGNPNNLTASPLVGGTLNAGVFGFSVASNDQQQMTAVSVRFDANPSLFLQNFELYTSADNDYSTANTLVTLAASPTITGTGPFFLNFVPSANINLSTTPVNFFVVADVLPTVSTTASAFQASITNADITVVAGLTSGSASGVDYSLTRLTATIASLNTTSAPNNVTASPITGGESGNGIFGFSVTSNGNQTISSIAVQFDANPATYLQNWQLLSSADVDYATANTPIAVSSSNVSGTGPYFITFVPTAPIDISNGAFNFFIAADVLPTVATGTSVIQASLQSTGIAVSQGDRAGSATGVDYALTQLTAAIASLNVQGAPNNVAASPIVGGTPNNGIFGFSLTSNGNQAVQEIRFRFPQDPTPYLENFVLVQSGDVNYATANSIIPLTGPATVSGTGPYFVTLSPLADIDISNGTSYFFLVADVKASVATTTNAFTPSLTTSDIDLDRGFAAGSSAGNSYSLTQLTVSISQLTAGIAPSPLAAGTSGTTSANAILGFSLQSNGVQSANSIAISVDQNPATRFASYALIVSGDNSFATTGDNAIVPTSSINVTGAGPYTITITPTSAQALSALKNYFLVATIDGGVNTTTLPSITPTLTNAGIVVDRGFVTTTTLTGSSYTFIPSNNSTITFNAATFSSNIAYGSFQSGAAMTQGASVALGTFTINDGASDADTQSTILSELTVSLGNHTDLREVAIFDGATNLSQKTAAASVTFDLLTLTATDNGTKQFTIRATFNAPVVDKNVHQVTITNAVASTSGSNFSSANAGGATTGNGATVNNVVVTADRIRFVETMPVVADVNALFTLTVRAVDALGSTDIDQTQQVVLSVSGGPGGFTGDSQNATQNLVAGQFQWTGLKIDLSGDYDVAGNHATFAGGNDASGTLTIESLGITLTDADLNLCAVGSGSTFSTLGNIVLTESDPGDFIPGTDLTYLLILPTGFEFRTSGYSPTVSFTPAKNITATSAVSFIGTTIAKFTYSVSGTNQLDVLTISGLQVKNNSATVAGNITRSGTGLVKGTNEVISHGTLTPGTSLTGDIQVEAQPGEGAIDPTTDRFGVDDPAVILNGFVGGNPVPFADGTFSGNGVSVKAMPAPINANRYIFSPEAVNVGNHLITLTYKNPTTGCISVITETFRVQDLAIIGLQEQFCTNDNVTRNLSVDPSDVPGGYSIHDYVYFDTKFDDVLYPIDNSTDLGATEVKFYANNTFPLTQVALTTPVTKTITAITVNPFNLLNGVYDYDGAYGFGYRSTSITNPVINNLIAVYTSFVRLTITGHGYSVGDRILINQSVDYVYPYISFQEYTVRTVIDANNIIINIGEPFTGNVNTDWGYSEFYLYSPSDNIAVTKTQTFGTYIDFVVPGHGFATGDRITIEGFGSFNPYINFNRFTVTKLDANTIRINIQEIYGSSTTSMRGTWNGISNFGIRADPYIPLPGYVYDATKPFPHKGDPRSATTNAQFLPSAFTTNWPYQFVQVYDRVMLTTCAGTTGPGCQPYLYHSVRVNLVAPPVVDFTGLATNYCNVPGAPIVLTATPPVDGTFTGPGIVDGGSNNFTAQFTPFGQATETPLDITFTYTLGCTGTMTKQVYVRALPTVDAGADVTVCEGTQVTLGASGTDPVAVGNGPFNYLWDNSSGTLNDLETNEKPKATPTGNTTYGVTVTDAYNCQNTDNIAITINNKVIADAIAPSEICGNDANGIPLTSSITGALNSGSWLPSTSGTFYDVNGNITAAYPDAVRFIPNINSGSVTLTLQSDDPAGPCPSDDDQVVVNISPAAGIEAGTNFTVCASDKVVVTTAQLLGSATSLTWDVQNGTGTIPAGDETKLQPEYIPSANEKILGATIILRATSNAPSSVCGAAVDNISIQIDRVAAVDAGLDVVKCQDEAIVLAASIPANSSASQLTWSGGSNQFSDINALNPTYTPNSAEFGQTVTLTVTSDDPAGPCTAQSDVVSVRINVKPEPPIPVIPEPYCVGELIQPLTAIGNNIRWYGQENLTDFRFNGTSFLTGESANQDKVLRYYATQTSPEGCQSLPARDSIIVYPNPLVNLSVQNVCDQDVTQFGDLSSLTFQSPELSGFNEKFGYDFGYAGGAGSLTVTNGQKGDIDHKFPGPGIYNVNLIVTSSNGCATTFTRPVEIGRIPAPAFTYNYVCQGDETEFTSDLGTSIPLNRVQSYAWDFGDNSAINADMNPTYRYSVASSSVPYSVTLTVTSDLQCVGTVTRPVAILPVLQAAQFPYTESFENGRAGWATIGFPQDERYSWKLPNDMAGNSVITSASDGNRAWIVSNPASGPELRTSYFDNERSTLNSPCINVTELNRPVMSFDYWLSTTPSDGVYMEASTDGGLTWQQVGTVGEGIGWYNSEDILGLSKVNGVGQDFNQFGWSGSEAGWKSAKFSLDNYKTAQRLRLRFVFGSNSDNPLNQDFDGFGLDNFRLDSRNRIVLLENYTSSTQTVNNNNFRDFAPALTNNEIVKLQYHTGISDGNDPIFRQNMIDPSARAAFYGLTNGTNVIPRVFLDGSSSGGFAPNSNWAMTQLSTRALAVSPFELNVETVENSSGALEIKTTLSANRPMTEGRPALFIAVIEKMVDGNSFVVRKMLPNASGQRIPLPSQAGPISVDNQTWLVDIENVDLGDLAVVAFVQDLDNNAEGVKEVYQADIDLNPLFLPSTITGIEDLNFAFHVYPNPADDEMTVVLPDNITDGANLRMFDQVGKVVIEEIFEKGEHKKTLTTATHAGGVYLLQIKTSKGILTRKVMLLHER